MLKYFFSGLLLLAGLAASSVQAADVVVGNHNLLPNTPGQTILINVTGGDLVEGLNFNAQVADGGPEAAGSIDGPEITAGDIVTGTIFDPNNTGQVGGPIVPQVLGLTTTTASGTVSADGLLATLTIDTTGFNSGVFDLNLSNTANGATDFAGVPINITDGTITIIPEPASIALIGIGGLLMLRRRRA